MKSLQNKVVIITGAGSGIGQTTAIQFAAAGSKVIVADFSDKGGNETVQKIKEAGGEATFIKTDVSNNEDVQAMVARTVEVYGRLDCAFNNAGVGGTSAPIHDFPEDIFDNTVAIDLKGVFLCMKYELQQFLKQDGAGSIINMASVSGLNATPNMVAYSASKFAVIGMTKTAAIEYAERGIRVNAVCPGSIETPGLTQGEFGKFLDMYRSHQPMKRFGTPEEVANAVLWLSSDEASLITGVSLPTDGGLSAK
ncbi:glucose 1-dehydrogenase [Pedobacter sp. MC2016-05]|uniref:glucose 1-dehydrogenase n=1 Tax=Pedobacter sp. MC2016-05 TaxID=2994474 RepID=UPI0022462FC6|nr:glucose 1-dehydrogenase [Pedobacter sp. MC2016-05]MCX2475347.1 glucose 1-dehydrogenase [Pedobacter sp. MC2016-05]